MKRIYIILMAALGSAATPLPFIVQSCSADETEPAQLSLTEGQKREQQEKTIENKDQERRNREINEVKRKAYRDS